MTTGGRLPPGWAPTTLGEIASIKGGLTKGKKRGPQEVIREVPYLRVANVQRGHLDLTEVRTIPASDEEVAELHLRSGDVLFNEGGDRDKLGRGWVWEGQIPVCIHQNHVFRARLLDGFSPKFVSMYANHVGQSYFLRHGKQTTNLASINLTQLANLPLCLPPTAQQHRIVARIEALQAPSDAAREALDAIPPLLEKFRQSVLAAAFRGDLTKAWREGHPDVEPASKLLERIRAERRRKWGEANPKKKYVEPERVDAEGLPELPDGWCWARAEELAWEITVGHVGPMKHRYVPNGVPFLRSQNVRENRFDSTGLLFIDEEFHRELPKSSLSPGDLLVVRSGAPGTACVLPEEVGRANCADLVITRLLPGLIPRLAAIYVNSEHAKAQVRSAQVGMAQQHFNVGSMKEMIIPLMPEGEQDELLKVLTDRLESAAAIGRAATEAASIHASLNESILAKAFRGELVPQDPNDEPASVLLERTRRERDAEDGAAEANGQKGRRRGGKVNSRSDVQAGEGRDG